MKAIRVHEHGGTGTLKLESQTTRCWFEFTMPVYPVDCKFQARPRGSCAVNGAASTFENEEPVNSILIAS